MKTNTKNTTPTPEDTQAELLINIYKSLNKYLSPTESMDNDRVYALELLKAQNKHQERMAEFSTLLEIAMVQANVEEIE